MILVLPWLIGAGATATFVWGFNKIKNAWDEEDKKKEEEKGKKGKLEILKLKQYGMLLKDTEKC